MTKACLGGPSFVLSGQKVAIVRCLKELQSHAFSASPMPGGCPRGGAALCCKCFDFPRQRLMFCRRIGWTSVLSESQLLLLRVAEVVSSVLQWRHS